MQFSGSLITFNNRQKKSLKTPVFVGIFEEFRKTILPPGGVIKAALNNQPQKYADWEFDAPRILSKGVNDESKSL